MVQERRVFISGDVFWEWVGAFPRIWVLPIFPSFLVVTVAVVNCYGTGECVIWHAGGITMKLEFTWRLLCQPS
jgi:hypothetical protein